MFEIIENNEYYFCVKALKKMDNFVFYPKLKRSIFLFYSFINGLEISSLRYDKNEGVFKVTVSRLEEGDVLEIVNSDTYYSKDLYNNFNSRDSIWPVWTALRIHYGSQVNKRGFKSIFNKPERFFQSSRFLTVPELLSLGDESASEIKLMFDYAENGKFNLDFEFMNTDLLNLPDDYLSQLVMKSAIEDKKKETGYFPFTITNARFVQVTDDTVLNKEIYTGGNRRVLINLKKTFQIQKEFEKFFGSYLSFLIQGSELISNPFKLEHNVFKRGWESLKTDSISSIYGLDEDDEIHFSSDLVTCSPLTEYRKNVLVPSDKIEGFLKTSAKGNLADTSLAITYGSVNRMSFLDNAYENKITKPLYALKSEIEFNKVSHVLDSRNLPVIRIESPYSESMLKNKAPHLWDLVISDFKNSHASVWKMAYLAPNGNSFIREFERANRDNFGDVVSYIDDPTKPIENIPNHIKRLICVDSEGVFQLVVESTLVPAEKRKRLNNISQIKYLEVVESLSDSKIMADFNINLTADAKPVFIHYLPVEEGLSNEENPYKVYLNCAYEGRLNADSVGGSGFIDWKDSYQRRSFLTFQCKFVDFKPSRQKSIYVSTSRGGFGDIRTVYTEGMDLEIMLGDKFNPKCVDTITLLSDKMTPKNQKFHYLRDEIKYVVDENKERKIQLALTNDISDNHLGEDVVIKGIVGYRDYE